VRGRKVLMGTVALGIAALVVGCGEARRTDESQPAAADAGRLSVYVVNYPLQYMAERIGGDLVQVEFPAPSDVDPAYWSPEAETIAAYQGADLILLNGAHYAGWVDLTTLPASKLVKTSQTFEERYIELEGAVTHSHGPEGEHAHGDLAFTTWLDPTLALEQARAIQQAFAAALPEHEAVFQQHYAALERDVLSLDNEFGALFAANPERPLLASHPVYQYLARRYDLNLMSVHFEPDEFPDEASWGDLGMLLRDHPADMMLWEAEPLDEIAARLREMGIESVIFDPCANRPEAGDLASVMAQNLADLQAAL
jgi:zinc transport system substrate-binding protein